MASFNSVESKLLSIYGRFMHLKLFVDNSNINNNSSDQLVNEYTTAVNKHNNKIINNPHIIDAGFDIFTAASQSLTNQNVNKVDFNVACACKMVTQTGTYNTGFYMYPRSSISKTPLRLANNVGIIDAGYRGHLIGMFDLNYHPTYMIKELDRYLQICAPGLVPILVELVNSADDLGEETERGAGGFGSTGR
jgi:dUTP pyrophosphatase